MALGLQGYFRETASGLRRNGIVAFAAMSTAFIALFLFGLALLIAREFNLVIDAWTGNVEVGGLPDGPGEPRHREAAHDQARGAPRGRRGHVREQGGGLRAVRGSSSRTSPTFIENVDCAERSFPASLRVKLADTAQFAQVRRDRVQTDATGKRRADRIDGRTTGICSRASSPSRASCRSGSCRSPSIMLASAVALIANTLRMGMFARRKEIGIMRLVGATNWRIRVPFLIEGLVESLLGAAAAVFALFLVKVIFIDRLRGRDQVLPARPEPRRAGDRAVDPDRGHR